VKRVFLTGAFLTFGLGDGTVFGIRLTIALAAGLTLALGVFTTK
jgi:hypothetical protein